MIPAAKPLIGDEELEAVTRVLSSGILAQGPEVETFESEFSCFVNGRSNVAVNSGTSGLHLALIAAGIKDGDEVIVPSFTFAATANSVKLVGGIPVFVDIDERTFNLDAEAVEAAITNRTRAIQPVHLYGQPAAMDKIMDIANRHNLLVLEDAAQAHLAKFNDQYVGTFGIAATFSFYPTKNMTSGEGGMISCANTEIDRRCRLLRNQGMEKRYQNEIIGFNMRMTDLHAAIGRAQLRKIDKWTKIRQSNAKFFDENLLNVKTPYKLDGAEHVYHQYTIRIVGDNRDKFAEEMAKRGVGSGVYYPTPVHKLPSFNLDLDLPKTDLACKEVLSIPVHPALSQVELEKIVEVINSIAKAGS